MRLYASGWSQQRTGGNPGRDESSIRQLTGTLRGRLIQPDDPDYDEARAIYNAMIDKRPRLIVQCANVADVIAAVKFGREQDLTTAIRGGGHNGPGLALAEDGLVIDLSPMKGIRVDPDANTVRVEPGCQWGDVDHATHAFGLATVSGIISTTGVPGLTLGGGHGYLSRRYGLTIDNLLAADVVLADGRLVHTSENENPDLFWALKGGGGNFGVVTSFEFRLHPVDTVVGGPLFWPIEQLDKAMRWYRDWLPQAPDDVFAFFMIGEVPVAEPIFEHVGPVPYPALQSLFDPLYPPGLQWYWKGDFVGELTDEAIAVHKRFGEVPTGLSTMHLYPIDAAVNRVAPEATAWGFREATWSMVIAGVDQDPDNRDKIRQWARDYWEAVHPHSAGASYINFMMEEGQDRIKATYGSNYERLQNIKGRYDPDNFFHVNQNIEPSM